MTVNKNLTFTCVLLKSRNKKKNDKSDSTTKQRQQLSHSLLCVQRQKRTVSHNSAQERHQFLVTSGTWLCKWAG